MSEQAEMPEKCPMNNLNGLSQPIRPPKKKKPPDRCEKCGCRISIDLKVRILEDTIEKLAEDVRRLAELVDPLNAKSYEAREINRIFEDKEGWA